MTGTRLTAHQLTLRMGKRTLCEALDLQVHPGECWAILGPNGSGKTTLLHTLAGLLPAHSGDVRLNNKSIDALPRRHIAQQLGLLPQDHSDAFPATVLQTALMGRHPHLGALAWEGKEDEKLARNALASVGLDGYEQRDTDTLSGGERRRLGLATLFTQDPACLLLDEPSNHLDIPHQVQALHKVSEAAAVHNKAVVMVLHDINLASRFCNRVLMLFGNGEHLSGESTELLTPDNLTRLYGHPMQQVADTPYRAWLPG